MALSQKERSARYRARKRGEYIPEIKARKGFKQTQEHIEKRKRFGPDHHSWKGNKIKDKSGRSRALRLFKKGLACEFCGEKNKRLDRHHKDENTLNNNKENIIFLCRKCHMKIDGRYEKFINLSRIKQNEKTIIHENNND
jgi:hypothetical protein